MLFCFFLITLFRGVLGEIASYDLSYDAARIQTQCLELVAHKSFIDKPILVIFETEMQDWLPEIINYTQLKYDFRYASIYWKDKYYYYNHVIVVSNTESVIGIVEKYKNSPLFDPKYSTKGKVIIVAQQWTNFDATIKYFWNNYFVNIISIRGTEIYLANPFTNGSACGKVVQQKKIGDCSNFSKIWDRYPKNLSNCTLNAATFGKHIKMPYLDDTNLLTEQTGIFIQPLRVLINNFNLKINYITPDDEIQINYTIVGTKFFLKNLTQDRIYDLLVVEPFRLPNTSIYYESSEIIFFERKVWVTPKPKQLSKITVLVHLFQLNLWAGWFFVLLLITGLLWFFYKNCNLLESFFLIYALSIGLSVPEVPENLTTRCLILFYLIYAFHIIYFFQGQLSSVLTSPSYEAPINSLERLAYSKLFLVFYYHVNLETLRNSLNPHVGLLSNKSFLYETDSYNPPELVLTHDNYSSNCFAHNSNITEAHKKQLVFFPDTILYSLEATYTARKGYPLLPTLNKILMNIRESGLYYKWLSDLQKIAFIPDNEDGTVVLSFDHLQAAFVLLIIGLVLSIVVFIIEMIVYKRPFNKTKLY